MTVRDNRPLIINVRGTSGSGKTTLTREFMSTLKHEDGMGVKRPGAIPQTLPGQTKPGGYYGWDKTGRAWFIVGSYENTCGGCDTIKTQAEIIERVQWAVDMGMSVWLEGLILSTIYGTVGAFSEQFGDRWLFCYLDTPVDVCLTRVLARRSQAGNSKAFNPVNTRVRHATILRNMAIATEKGRAAHLINHQRPLASIQRLIKQETT